MKQYAYLHAFLVVTGEIRRAEASILQDIELRLTAQELEKAKREGEALVRTLPVSGSDVSARGGHRADALCYAMTMQVTITLDREEDGRWIAEVPELPGVLVYGATDAEAMRKAEVLALRVLADRIEHGEAKPVPVSIVLPAAA